MECIILPSTYKVQTIPYGGVPFANCIFEAMSPCDVYHFGFILEVSIGIKPLWGLLFSYKLGLLMLYILIIKAFLLIQLLPHEHMVSECGDDCNKV